MNFGKSNVAVCCTKWLQPTNLGHLRVEPSSRSASGSRSQPAPVREAGAKGPAAPPGRDRSVCLRFGSAAAPFTTPPKLKLTASSHVGVTATSNVYAVARKPACAREAAFCQQGPRLTLAELPRHQPSLAANASADAAKAGG